MGRRALPIEYIRNSRRRLVSLNKRERGFLNKIREAIILQNDPETPDDQNLELLICYRARHVTDRCKTKSFFLDSKGQDPKRAFARWSEYGKKDGFDEIGKVSDYVSRIPATKEDAPPTIKADVAPSKKGDEATAPSSMEIEIPTRGDKVIDSGKVLRKELKRLNKDSVF